MAPLPPQPLVEIPDFVGEEYILPPIPTDLGTIPILQDEVLAALDAPSPSLGLEVEDPEMDGILEYALEVYNYGVVDWDPSLFNYA